MREGYPPTRAYNVKLQLGQSVWWGETDCAEDDTHFVHDLEHIQRCGRKAGNLMMERVLVPDLANQECSLKFIFPSRNARSSLVAGEKPTQQRICAVKIVF